MTSDASLADQTFFQGFSNPTQNWSRLPNALIDALPLVETLAELKVILYVLRHTWGYKEYGQARRISLDEFMNGRKDSKGKRIDHGVGMAKRNVIEGIRRGIKHGFLMEDVNAKDKARIKKCYRLAMYQNDTSDEDDQMYQNDTADVSKRYTEGIKSIHRTKNKETLERNSGKKESAQPAVAVAQPPQPIEPETKREGGEVNLPPIVQEGIKKPLQSSAKVSPPDGFTVAYSDYADGRHVAHVFKSSVKQPGKCAKCHADLGTWSQM